MHLVFLSPSEENIHSLKRRVIRNVTVLHIYLFFCERDVVSVQQLVIQVHLTAAHLEPSMWSAWAPPRTDSGLQHAQTHI